jgi:dTMP kinase
VIVALEGVSSTGKTTLAAALTERLGWQTIPCYYHLAADPAELGALLSDCDEQQLAALDAHLRIEERRFQLVEAALERDSGVVLDRSVDTLLAHARAAGYLRGLDTRTEARRRVLDRIECGRAVRPDLTLLLTADVHELARRTASRTGMPSLFLDPQFITHFTAHFADPVAARCRRLPAGEPQATLAAALAQITQAHHP